jgi:hypothetical protein
MLPGASLEIGPVFVASRVDPVEDVGGVSEESIGRDGEALGDVDGDPADRIGVTMWESRIE